MSKKLLALSLTALSLLTLLVSRPRQSAAEASEPLRYRFSSTRSGAAPLELTAADGTGLKLKLYQARTVLQGPLAFTELRLTFENPEDRVREGRFRLTLPEQAAISRFAMRIEDRWQEAEMVERQAARRAYEDFLHRRQDPALLEKAAGNEFRARIFPIPAKGEKELILSYSQEISSAQDYLTLPLDGLSEVEDFELEVLLEREGELKKLSIQEKNYTPEGDFQLDGLSTESAVTDGTLMVARVTPKLEAAPQRPKELLVLLDTSASRALGLKKQKALLAELIRELPTLKRVTVAAFDQDIESLYSGSPSRLNWKGLERRGAFGATDLEKALQWAVKQKKHKRLLLVTDGVSTAGEKNLRELLQNSHFERVDALAVGGIRDKGMLKPLVQSGTHFEGIVLDSQEPASKLATSLQQSVTSGLDVSVEGANWVWPSTLNNMQPGDQTLIYAKFLQAPEGPVEVSLGSQTLISTPRALENSPLLERSAAVAQIAHWESQLAQTEDPEAREELNEKIVNLSRQQRVLSDQTALLVLETEADYERFEIDRKALSDILTVNPTGLVLEQREELSLPTPAEELVEKDREKGTPSKNKEVADGMAGEAPSQPGQVPPPPPEPAMEEEESPLPRPDTLRVARPARRRQAQAPVAQSANAPVSGLVNRSEIQNEVSPEPVSNSGATLSEDSEVEDVAVEAKVDKKPPLTGPFAEIEILRLSGKKREALRKAKAWQAKEPGNVLALVALGNCLVDNGQEAQAARVFGSIIDLFPSRADLRRYAGSRLQSLEKDGLSLAVDSFRKAVEQRPDHVSSHRYLAYALARSEDYPAALEALEAGLSRNYPSGRFAGYQRILKEDLGILAAAWKARAPKQKTRIYARLKKYDAQMAKQPSLRFVLTWETDANDVDFHIRDEKGGHAYYSQKQLPSGGELYADVTTGYGPECFTIEGKPKAAPYDLEIHYYSRGPMGYGMGQLEILKHDGKGGLSFEERPYVVMEDGAYVDLGQVR